VLPRLKAASEMKPLFYYNHSFYDVQDGSSHEAAVQARRLERAKGNGKGKKGGI